MYLYGAIPGIATEGLKEAQDDYQRTIAVINGMAGKKVSKVTIKTDKKYRTIDHVTLQFTDKSRVLFEGYYDGLIVKD